MMMAGLDAISIPGCPVSPLVGPYVELARALDRHLRRDDCTTGLDYANRVFRRACRFWQRYDQKLRCLSQD